MNFGKVILFCSKNLTVELNCITANLHIVSYGCNAFQPALIHPSDNQLSLADFDAVQVIGKGNGGIVRLVQHKWTGQFFALKVWRSSSLPSITSEKTSELLLPSVTRSLNKVFGKQNYGDY